MDYSQSYYAAPQQPPFAFLGQPLSQGHPKVTMPEDYNRISPPELAFDQIPTEQQYHFEQSFPAFHASANFTRPPSPPLSHPTSDAINGAHEVPHPGGQALSNGVHAGVSGVSRINGTAHVVPTSSAEPAILTQAESGTDLDLGQQRQDGVSDEDGDMHPGKARRKEQNRAAQRAFRERKERHVKDLEHKLAASETARTQTAGELEKLKRDLQKMSTENEILKATAPGTGSPNNIGMAHTTFGPLSYNPVDFYTDVLAPHDNKMPSHRIVRGESGQRLYAAGATWDLIIGHELFKRGLVDIADISNRLKTQAKCDGQGPVFEESAIMAAIEQSVASGSDELI